MSNTNPKPYTQDEVARGVEQAAIGELREVILLAIQAQHEFWDRLNQIEELTGVDLDYLDCSIQALNVDDLLLQVLKAQADRDRQYVLRLNFRKE